jgi:hypothetical protein
MRRSGIANLDALANLLCAIGLIQQDLERLMDMITLAQPTIANR